VCPSDEPAPLLETPMSDAVTFESAGDVAILRIDDGKANALSHALLGQINSALDQAEEAGQAVLMLGRPGKFCAGFDLSVMQGGGPSAAVEMVKAGAVLGLRLARFPAPVVIGATGHALAMGAVLLCTVDTRIGALGAFKLGFNEVAIGMTTPIFLLEMARARMSKRHFYRAVVQSEIYSPEAAVDAGLLDQVVAPEALEETARAEVEKLAKLPRKAYVNSRALVHAATLAHIEATLDADLQKAFGGAA